ncbi:MAG: hypothetical protein F6K17_14780 [Okeania sp. SIO3C4]|nr:hypothetical protein [Okeania sp. SIO3C4]
MKLKSVLSTIAASAVAFAVIATFSQPSFAQRGKTVYFCGKSSAGIPTTYARTASGKRIPIIRWEKDWSEKYTPEKRCEIVSKKIQEAEEKDVLKVLKVGLENNQRVICAAKNVDEACEVLLFTLRSGDDPNKLLGTLIGTAYSSGSIVIHSDDPYEADYYELSNILSKESE